MSRPRYQVSSPVPDENCHYVVDTHADEGRYRRHACEDIYLYSYADACYLAQWLNERAKGYPAKLAPVPEYPSDSWRHGYMDLEAAQIYSELQAMCTQSLFNWFARGGAKS